MAKLSILAGTTSKLATIFVQNSSVTTGAGLTGLAFGTSGLTAYYLREGAGSTVSITLATMTLGTWATGGFIVADATNMPGTYQIGIPNAAIAAGAKSVAIYLQGATNMAPTVLEIELTAVDNQNANTFGLAYLPQGPMMVKKNQALTAFMFIMRSSVDHITPINSATITSIRLIDGGAPASTTNSAAYVATSSGCYSINMSAADLNGNNIMFQFSATGCDTLSILFMTQP